MKWRDVKKRRRIEHSASDNHKEVKYGRFLDRGFGIVMDTFLLLTPVTILTGLIFGYDALKNPELNQNAGNFQMGLYLIVTVAFWKIARQTPGKKAFNLEVVDAKTLRDVPLWRLVIRFISYFLSMVTIIGFFIPLMREDRRALHDLIAGTSVIEKVEKSRE